MNGSNQNGNNPTVHFGVFDADLRTHELRKHGIRVKLPRQSFQVLQMLLARQGDLVTREELQKALWPADTFVDFDHGLNNAVKRIRAVLGDSAETPHWIETLPRLGYRFIGPVEPPANGASSNGHSSNGHASNGHSSNGDSSSENASAATIPTTIVGSTTAVRPSQHRTNRWLWASLAVVAALLLTALGLHYRMRRSAAALESLRIVPFTSYPGLEFSPTFSPDGNQIAFAWTGGESLRGFDLYVKVVGTDTPVALTHNPAAILIPAWSPDGRFIAFSRLKRNSPSDTGIFLIPAVGGTELKLTDLRFQKNMFQGGIDWSPDSQSLVYTEAGEVEFSSRLAVLNVQMHERRSLAQPAPQCVGVGLARFSPDGRTLASACILSFGLGEIYVQPWPSGAPRRILQAKGDLEGLTWSRDGQSLVYSLGGNLWRIAARGGQPERLWFGQGAYAPAIARAGSRLAYSHGEKLIEIWRIPIGKDAVLSTPPLRLAPSDLAQQNPRYSPDGTKIAFESTRSGSPEIWVCDADGSHLVQLTSFGGPLTGTPSWSPDGKRIVFDSRASGRPELYMIDAQGGGPKLFPTNPEGGSVPYWSHDGRWIYFSSDLNGASQLYKVRADGGKPVSLGSGSGLISKESFDGKRLYYERIAEGTELWSVSTDGGDARREEGLPGLAWTAWEIGRTGIYYFDSVYPGDSVKFFDFRTGRLTKVGKLVGPVAPFMGGISVSPDETNLLYSSESRVTADIELVEGFR
jgi:Tol biopolymer transport system component/DNA-binding winged helix-turn-helix (wHTH) protein